MNELFSSPLTAVKNVFNRNVPDTSAENSLFPPEPNEHIIGVASERAQMFFNYYRHLAITTAGTPSEAKFATMPIFGMNTSLQVWNFLPPEARKNMVVRGMLHLYWEQIFADMPQALNVVNATFLRQGYKVCVEGEPVFIKPEVCPRDDQMYRFMKRLEDIFAGKCAFECDPDFVCPPGGIRVGRLENEMVKQIVMFETKARRRGRELFPETNDWKIDCKFAGLPHMEYIRNRRMFGRMSAQLNLLQSLIIMGLMDEKISMTPPPELAQDGMFKGQVQVDSEWNIVLLPSED